MMRSTVLSVVLAIVFLISFSSLLQESTTVKRLQTASLDPEARVALTNRSEVVRSTVNISASTASSLQGPSTARLSDQHKDEIMQDKNIATSSSLQDSILSSSIHQSDRRKEASPSCHSSIRDAMGIYENPTKLQQERFGNVVLVTAVNHGFIDLYYNWLSHVRQHGFKHVVFALDEAAHQNISYSLPFFSSLMNRTGDIPEGMGAFKKRRRQHLKVVCSKMELKLEILQKCADVGMLFSDVDVALKQDPFEHDLGRLLPSYDYLYSVDEEWINTSRTHGCFRSSEWPRKFREGNTGFDYTVSSKWIIDIMVSAMKLCQEPGNVYHDQKLFWDQMRIRQYNLDWNWTHCDEKDYEFANISRRSPSLCCLDLFHYPSGGVKPTVPVVTYHANGVSGLLSKIERLQIMDAWNI